MSEIPSARAGNEYNVGLNGFGARNKASKIVVLPVLFEPRIIVNGSRSISPCFIPLKFFNLNEEINIVSFL